MLTRTLKAVGFAGLGLAGLVAIVLFLLLLAPVRDRILSYALPRVTGSLPGTLSVSDAGWPSLNALHFEGVSWEADGVTVLSADTLAASVRLLPILSRDIEAHYLVARGLSVDIPGIRAMFAPTDSAPAESGGKPEKQGFPRGGSVPGLPSISIDSLSITAPAIELSPGSRIEDLVLEAGIDLSRRGAPGLKIKRLSQHGGGQDWKIDDLKVALNIGGGILKGSGTGALSADLPFHLEIEPAGRDQFVIAIGKEPGGLPPEKPGARVAIRIERDGRRITAAEYDIKVLTPGTDELREVRAIAGRIKSLPDSRGINLSAKGRVGFVPDLDVGIRIAVQEPEWLDRGVAVARYTKETLYLDSLLVSLLDLDISAQGYLSPDSAVASAEIRAAGSDGLKVIAPDAGIPDSLDVWLRASIDGNLKERYLDGELDARGKVGGLDLDTLNLAAGISLDKDRASSVRLSASSEGMVISTRAEIDRRDAIIVRLEPMSIRPVPYAGRLAPNGVPARSSAPQPMTGTVTYVPESGDVRVENLKVQGSLGDLTLNAHLSGEGAGSFDIACIWQEPPLPLMARITDSPGLLDAFRTAWALDAPYSLDVNGDLQPGEGGKTMKVSAGFALPGPRTFAVFLPEGAKVGTLGPVAGIVEFQSVPVDTLTDYRVRLNLDRTEWVSSSLVDLRWFGPTVSVDSLMLRADRLRLDLKGGYDLNAQAGDIDLALSDSGFVGRLYPALPEMDLKTAGHFATGGSLGADLSLEASIRGDGYSVPAVEGSFRRDGTGTRASASLPEGAKAGAFRLNLLEVDYEVEGPVEETGGRFFPAAISVRAAGGEFALSQKVRLDIGDSVACTVMAMDLSISDRNLIASRPFTVVIDRSSQAIHVDDMNLEGTLGTINARGRAGPDSVGIEASVELDLPPSSPPALGVPEVLWPDKATVRILAKSRYVIHADAAISGFLLDDASKGTLNLNADAVAGDVRADVRLSDGLGQVLGGSISLPGSLSVYPPSAFITGGHFRAELDLDRFPLAVKKSADGRDGGSNLVVRLAGSTILAGPVDQPGGHASVTVTFPAWPEMTDFSVAVEALLRPDSTLDETVELRAGELAGRVGKSLGVEKTESLVASLRMSRGAKSVLDADLSYPVWLSLYPYGVGADSSRIMNAALRSRALPLEEIDLLTPVGVGLDGTCAVDLSATGPAEDPALSGSLEAEEFKIEIANLAHALLSGNASVAGTARRPSISGNFTVESGAVTMPESRPELHPVEGEAILLDQAKQGLAPADSARGVALASPGFKADYDVRIDIPSDFWLRGDGLEIELRGALQITQKNGLPVIVGDLIAQRGTYLFLGRVFDLERGIVNFYGTEEINPTLDISLASSIEGTRIWINLTGDLAEPRLGLVSDPEMTDGDIMATILFGKPLNELNDGQGTMLRERVTDVLVAMGAARLQQEVAGRYGIDLVTIRSGRGGDQENALVVGKYLTPKILVMYEHGLKQQATSYIVMEYLLHRNVLVETLYGNDGRSSIGISLQKDY